MHLRQGFSLIEVMISLGILTVVVSALFSQMFTLQTASGLSRERATVNALTLTLSNAFAGASFTELRTPALKWSLGRYCPATATAPIPPTDAVASVLSGVDANVPLTDDINASPANCLLRYTANGTPGLGLLDMPTGLSNLKVWVEYYRGNDYDTNANGIIESSEKGLIDSPPAGIPSIMMPHMVYDNHVPAFINSGLTSFRLTTTPTDQEDPEGTVLIRIVMTYQIQSIATASGNGAPSTYFMSSFALARRR